MINPRARESLEKIIGKLDYDGASDSYKHKDQKVLISFDTITPVIQVQLGEARYSIIYDIIGDSYRVAKLGGKK